MMKINWEWLGGFFDGDGSASIYILKYNKWDKRQISLRPRIFFAQKDRKILEDIRDFLNLKGKYINENIDERRERKTVSYNLEVKGIENVKAVAEQLAPYSLIKRKQLELLVKFCSLRPSKRYPWRREEFLQALELLERITELNQKGYLRDKKTFELVKRLRNLASQLPPKAKIFPIYEEALSP